MRPALLGVDFHDSVKHRHGFLAWTLEGIAADDRAESAALVDRARLIEELVIRNLSASGKDDDTLAVEGGLDDVAHTFRKLGDGAFEDDDLIAELLRQLKPVYVPFEDFKPDDPNPWYTAKSEAGTADIIFADSDAPWEGIGEGWFFSALGGGADDRPKVVPFEERVPVNLDNTETLHAEAAVPSFFNGNFESGTMHKV